MRCSSFYLASGKIEFPSIPNRVVQKAAKDHANNYAERAIESMLQHFYINDFLDLFSYQTEALNVCKEISKIL